MIKKIKKKNKKGVSIMLGYILLITFGIIISVLVYSYLKTYVPKDILKCPDETSLFIKEITCENNIMTIVLKNNGKFNLSGYYIHGTNSTTQELATIDLSQNVTSDSQNGPIPVGNVVMFFMSSTNTFAPNQEKTHNYTIKGITLSSIEIIPMRYEQKGRSMRLASCGNAKIFEEIICPLL